MQRLGGHQFARQFTWAEDKGAPSPAMSSTILKFQAATLAMMALEATNTTRENEDINLSVGLKHAQLIFTKDEIAE